jgi:hypothetical protein
MDNILLYVLIALAAVIIVLLIVLIAKKPQQDNSVALLDQKLDITSKQTAQGLQTVSQQMNALTEKIISKC